MSLLEAIVKRVVKTVVQPVLHGSISIDRQRFMLDLLRFMPMPRQVRCQPCELGGIKGLQLTPTHKPLSGGAILYLHGGAYCIGSSASHKEMVARLAKTCQREAWLIDYGLAPEQPFPAAQEDALAAYEALLAIDKNIVVAGDSAGGGLSLSLMLAIKEKGLPPPKALVLFSPLTDLSSSGETMNTHEARDPMLTPSWLSTCNAHYAVDTSLLNPGVSPLFGDFTDFPPVLIQVGSEEILLDDSLRLEQQMLEQSVDVTLHQYDGLWHVFQVHAGMLKRAKAAMVEVADFIQAKAG